MSIAPKIPNAGVPVLDPNNRFNEVWYLNLYRLFGFLSSTSAVINFGTVNADSFVDSSAIPVANVNPGSVVLVGLPTSFSSGLIFTGYVSSIGNVKIRATNYTGSNITDSGHTYIIKIINN